MSLTHVLQTKGPAGPFYVPADSAPLRLVLDTNTVLALWMFADPALAGLRAQLDGGHITLLSRADALGELRHVLAYRQFALDTTTQATLYDCYAARCMLVSAAPDPAVLPRCRDHDDQKFLEIARDGDAALLITRDRALLRLDRHRLVRPLFRIVTPEHCANALSLPATGIRPHD